MMIPALKSLLRSSIRRLSGSTFPVLAGRLRGRRLLRSQTEHLSMIFGTYEAEFANAFADRIRESDVVYDVGANSGYFSLLAATIGGPKSRVLAFDPMPSVLNECEVLMERNHLSGSVECHQLALSSESGIVKMYTPSSDKTAILEQAVRHRGLTDKPSVSVEAMTMDEFVYTHGHPAPEVIKIDVEGAEAAVLRGAQRVLEDARPVLFVEVHGIQPAQDTWDLVVPTGYSMHLLTIDGPVRLMTREDWERHFQGSKWVIRHCMLTPSATSENMAA